MPHDHRRRAVGVAVAYHPFLHGTILACPGAFDGVEVGLDAYVDEARRGLLDPDLARLRELAAACPVTWRGQAFGLGFASPPGTAAIEATLVRLVGVAGPLALSETLSLGGPPGRPGSGLRLDPAGAAAARAAGRRADALRARLGCELSIELSLDRLAEADPGSTAIVLREFCAATSCDLDLALGPVMLEPERIARVIAALPPGRVGRVAFVTPGEAAWPALDAALSTARCGAVVVRRERQLFPIDDIVKAAARARSALARVGDAAVPLPRPLAAVPEPARAGTPRPPPDAADEPPRLAPRDVWRARLGEMFRAKQLARWVAHPASWET